jgi:hypothetical protein
MSPTPVTLVPLKFSAPTAAKNPPPAAAVKGVYTMKAKLPVTCAFEKADGCCTWIAPATFVPLLPNSIQRPLVATPPERVPTAMRNTLVPKEVTRVKHPRWSAPIEYELPVGVIGTLACTPPGPLLLMSSTHPVMFPFPSAVNDASIPTGPLASNPVSDRAY